MRPAFKLVLATAAFGVLHSALASDSAKRLAARALGEPRQRAFHRPFFVVQALLSTAALALYGRHLPTRTLWRLGGPAAWLLHAGQAAALVALYAGAREIGLGRVSGIDGLRAWWQGRDVPQPPVAQGPELDPASGRLTDGGAFRWSRHPLNFLAVPLFWLTPHLTTRRLAFNLAATLYLALGSGHEALRLRRAYGEKYRAYERSGAPFFWPRPPRCPVSGK